MWKTAKVCDCKICRCNEEHDVVCAESVVPSAAMSTAAGCKCTFQDTQFLAGSCGATFALFMGLVEYLVRSKDDIADACNRPGRHTIQVSECRRRGSG